MKEGAGKVFSHGGFMAMRLFNDGNHLGLMYQENISGERGHAFMKNQAVGRAFLL